MRTVTKHVVLLSGGLDSTVLATSLARTYGPDRVHALTVLYGQRHAKESDAAHTVARHLGIPILEADLSGLSVLLPSALTRAGATIPTGKYAPDNMAETVVPNRNAVLIMAAAGYASTLTTEGANVHVAVHGGDHDPYPDTTPAFIQAAHGAALEGTGGRVGVVAPYVEYPKSGVVRIGATIEAPMHLSWSCYEGGAVHCGRCGTCTDRRHAFTGAGVDDPTTYLNTALPLEFA